ncbi:RmlD substrate binding domain [Musa troglodytarum]|uniref:RmlD substrate binding domain n=1 Tax=Musa troglodytarum TaxID=320322 RepID=A0A9E7FPC5_9LILI|nr:RmlD substrate binding domain [Musa troglodytarum]URD99605.1 RmlD substrate binding domain [Musa troglodytarum]
MGWVCGRTAKTLFLIGGLQGRLCEDRGISFAFGSGRLENRAQLEADIAAAAALTHVFNAAGVAGRPNVDWCEDHRVDVETIRVNVVGTLTLGDLCRERGLLLVNCATGCIFEYDGARTLRASRRRTRPTRWGPSAPRLRPWLKNC